MSDVVIKVENLGKRYTISHEQRERYTALRDVLTNRAKRLGRHVFRPFVNPASSTAFSAPASLDSRITSHGLFGIQHRACIMLLGAPHDSQFTAVQSQGTSIDYPRHANDVMSSSSSDE